MTLQDGVGEQRVVARVVEAGRVASTTEFPARLRGVEPAGRVTALVGFEALITTPTPTPSPTPRRPQPADDDDGCAVSGRSTGSGWLTLGAMLALPVALRRGVSRR